MATGLSRVLIVGAGSGLSAAIARRFAGEGLKVALSARNVGKLGALAQETGAVCVAADTGDRAAVAGLFERLDATFGAPDVVVFNASARTRGPLVELDPGAVAETMRVGAYGGFLVAQEAVRRMLPAGKGVLLFTGASASVKGYAQSAPFAMAKFALRGLAQSLARELSPRGIHVGHVVVDGGIRSAQRVEAADQPDSMLDPAAIAEVYWQLATQPRSAWSWEIEVRPWLERF